MQLARCNCVPHGQYCDVGFSSLESAFLHQGIIVFLKVSFHVKELYYLITFMTVYCPIVLLSFALTRCPPSQQSMLFFGMRRGS